MNRDTWAAIDKAASELGWDSRAPTIIERICEEWALAQLERASRAARRYDQRDGTTTQDELRVLGASLHYLGREDDDLDPPRTADPDDLTNFAAGDDE
jgi:hypothetical protein